MYIRSPSSELGHELGSEPIGKTCQPGCATKHRAPVPGQLRLRVLDPLAQPLCLLGQGLRRARYCRYRLQWPLEGRQKATDTGYRDDQTEYRQQVPPAGVSLGRRITALSSGRYSQIRKTFSGLRSSAGSGRG